MASALIGLGANLGPRAETFAAALAKLEQAGQVCVTARSSWHETVPVGGPAEQPLYLNGAAILETVLSPQQVLKLLRAVERDLGRVRGELWGPRTLDLDLLMYDRLTVSESDLQLPHRWLPFRGFALEPAAEIAADWHHSVLRKSLAELRDDFLRFHPVLALAGGQVAQRIALARKLAASCSAYLLIAEQALAQAVAAFPECAPPDDLSKTESARDPDPRPLADRPMLFTSDYTQWDFPYGQRWAVYRLIENEPRWQSWAATPRTLLPKARIRLCAPDEQFAPEPICPEQHWNHLKARPLPTLRVSLGEPKRLQLETQAVWQAVSERYLPSLQAIPPTSS